VLGVVVSAAAGVGVGPGITLSVPPVDGPLSPLVMPPLAVALCVAGGAASALLPELTTVVETPPGGAALAFSGAGEPGMTTVAGSGSGSSLALSQPTAKAQASATALTSRT
jgi:hypothetical protein